MKSVIDKCSVTPQVFSICEFIGSMFLVIAAVAPIILFYDSIFGGNIYLAIVANSLAVGFVLFALIEIFSPICTAYFNPAVSFAMVLNKNISLTSAIRYSIAQILGGIVGIITCHLMFYDKIQSILVISNIERSGGAYLGEFLGTFILVLCILSLVHQKSDRVSLVVGLLVGGMLLSTSSTMFANPQVTIARMFTYSAAGIQPSDGLVFIIIQFIGSFFAFIVWNFYVKKCARVCST